MSNIFQNIQTIQLGGFLGGTIPNPTAHPVPVNSISVTTAPFQIVDTTMSGTLFFNASATVTAAFKLPAGDTPGDIYWFGSVTTHGLRVYTSSTDTIQLAGVTTTPTTGHVDFQTNGASGFIFNYASGLWIVMSQQGTVTAT